MMTADDTMVPQGRRQVMQLSAAQILRFLITEDELLDTLIMCKSAEIQLDMTEASLYTAIAAVRPEDRFKLNRLAKLLEVAHVHHGEKRIATHELVEAVRKDALRQDR